MSSGKKPHLKGKRVDPLENPHIAAELAKLQSVHVETETLMDRLYKESLEAEGKKATRVRVKARNPGPRTEAEKRKKYGAHPVPADDFPREFLTLGEAAKQLEFKWEKSVQRLIDAGKLKAAKQVIDGKKRWMIHRADFRSYRQLLQFKRKVSYVPTLDGQGDFGVVHVYGPWKKTTAARLPRYMLTVSIQDFWRLACKTPGTRSDYEAIKTELRRRIECTVEDFQVRYVFDRTTLPTLKRIIYYAWDKFPNHDLRGIEKRELINEALSHLQLKVFPNLWRAERGWVAYLRQGARNFFIDKARLFKKVDIPLSEFESDNQDELSDASDEPGLLAELAYQMWRDVELK